MFYINEDGEIYESTMTPAEQQAAFPGDDPTPYKVFADAAQAGGVRGPHTFLSDEDNEDFEYEYDMPDMTDYSDWYGGEQGYNDGLRWSDFI